MLVQSYRLPLGSHVTWRIIFEAYKQWLESRHNKPIQLDALVSPDDYDDFDYQTEDGGTEIHIRRYADEAEEISAIRVISHEPTATWKFDGVLQIIGDEVREFFLQTYYERSQADNFLPFVRKSPVLRQFIEMNLLDDDAGMPVSTWPIYGKEANWDLRVAIMRGDLDNVLPVVYLTRYEDNTLPLNLNPKYIAKQMAGIAHVIVDRDYHHVSLMSEPTCGNNVHSGEVGIYFPGSMYKQTYFPWDYNDRDEFLEVLLNDIRLAWLNRVDAVACTWDTIRSKQLHKRLEEWQNSSEKGQDELVEFMNAFDQENKALRAKNDELSRQVYSLRAKQEAYQHARRTEGGFFQRGEEPEFYPGETSDMLLSIITQILPRTDPNSRQHHLLQSLLAANPRVGECERVVDGVSSILSSIDRPTGSDISALEDLGFVMTRGNHWKMSFHGDPRYTSALAYTPSDCRSGKNSAAEIIGLINVEKKIF